MLPLLLFTTVYSMSSILHFVAASHVIIFISLDVRPFRENHFITFFNFFNSNNGTATTLDWSVNIWFGKWWQLTIINPALPGTNCSMQMLTDWSRTRFLNVVFTSIIISSHVESYETVYLFVIRICRIFVCSTIV
jgi:hypothetical protein